ncbi:glucan 1,3-beta-glucosidase [Auriculariales sp. MPI-PUGE-AT-0066]|nr:glucan 1,3-beta-glucosidase [Auriculariales sp. MPI-PUGE-AT-0066]
MVRSFGFVAIAVVALVDFTFAAGSQCSADDVPRSKQGTYWLETVKQQGFSPLNPDAGGYKIRRNVKDYGAVGDGVTDDSAAINKALGDQNRCSDGCVESTVVPGLIYFPPGKYLLKSPIVMNWYTQMVGAPGSPAELIAAADFVGMAIIDADPYKDGGISTWVNQNNFYRSLRNLVVDMTQLPVDSGIWGIHWQVSQATSIYNLRVEMSKDPATTHMGMFMENGSGGYMGDMVFNGGKTGLNLGNQQFTVRNLEVNDAQIAIYSNWNWVWTFIGTKVNNCGIAFQINTGGSVDAQTVGSNNIIDAVITNTKFFIQTTTDQPSENKGSFVIDNAELKGVEVAVGDANGAVILEGGDKTIASWAQGNVYSGTEGTPKYQRGDLTPPTKPASLLDSNGKFVQRERPFYEDVAAEDIISFRSEGAKGDGVTDDSDAIQAIFDKYAGCKVLFVDYGIYMVSRTIKIPVGTRLVGEAWSTIMGFGTNFQDINNPQVVFQVGKAGDVGVVEISDINFTTQGPAAGAIVMEWNVHEKEGDKGGAGMWDTFIRLGGAKGTNLDSGNCLKLTHTDKPECFAAFMGLHITQEASAYIEGLWVWLADHDIDQNNSTQITLFSGRGIYSESAGPVWLIGTGSEHHVLYQYNLVGAEDHFLSLIQTESPYFQPAPAAPAPFTPKCELDDPTEYPDGWAWALRVHDSENILVYGAGQYSFFNNYEQDCIPTRNCQKRIVDIASDSKNIQIFSLSTVATDFMLAVDNNGIIKQEDNTYGFQSTAAKWEL